MVQIELNNLETEVYCYVNVSEEIIPLICDIIGDRKIGLYPDPCSEYCHYHDLDKQYENYVNCRFCEQVNLTYYAILGISNETVISSFIEDIQILLNRLSDNSTKQSDSIINEKIKNINLYEYGPEYYKVMYVKSASVSNDIKKTSIIITANEHDCMKTIYYYTFNYTNFLKQPEQLEIDEFEEYIEL